MIRNRRQRFEGVRRLSLAVGGACVLPWLTFIFVGALNGNVDFKEMEWYGWALLALISAACFLFGWSTVRVVAWVRRGFAKDKRENVRPSD
jgi:hypothetical protein